MTSVFKFAVCSSQFLSSPVKCQMEAGNFFNQKYHQMKTEMILTNNRQDFISERTKYLCERNWAVAGCLFSSNCNRELQQGTVNSELPATSPSPVSRTPPSFRTPLRDRSSGR